MKPNIFGLLSNDNELYMEKYTRHKFTEVIQFVIKDKEQKYMLVFDFDKTTETVKLRLTNSKGFIKKLLFKGNFKELIEEQTEEERINEIL